MFVGLTGGIGSGKSSVAQVFAEQGAHVVDSDAIQRLVVAPGSAGLRAIEDEFGPQVLTEHGELNRVAMAELVFADEQARRRLEAITHPLIGEETRRQVASAASGQVVVHDIPLLVELGYAKNYELVVVVDAPEDVRLHRLVTDRGMTPEAALARIRSQATTEQRRAVADIWIDNVGTREDLRARALEVWRSQIDPAGD